MQSSNQPGKISVPFANSGAKQPIPVASQVGIEDGRASYTDGFPPLTRTKPSAGGKPPFGTDMNGILNAITAVQQWQSAGGGFKYDSTFATAIGGYPAGAMLVRSDNSGIWVNTVDNNSTDPEAGGTGWQPEGYGISTVAMTSANVTLTALQAARPIIIITGTLTASLNLIFPTYQKQWLVVNNATGAFSVTCKTSAGSGVSIATGLSQSVYGDGTNIGSASATQTQQSIVGAFSNLKASSTGLSALVSVTADEISLEASAGIYLTVRAVSLPSISMAGSGANGLDTGTSVASTWYSVWVISNGTTTAGLLSLSATAPTMPSGYTFKARVGWVRTDATANKYPLNFTQTGRRAQYRVGTGTNVAALPVIAQAASAIPLWTAIGTGGVVPPTASAIDVGCLSQSASSQLAWCYVVPNNNYSTTVSATAPVAIGSGSYNTSLTATRTLMTLESTNIYWGTLTSGGGSMGVYCAGWEDNL